MGRLGRVVTSRKWRRKGTGMRDEPTAEEIDETNQHATDDAILEYRPILLVVLIISGCSICYELIISAVSTYLLGNSVMQYSVTIGLYMAAMGAGAYLSKFVRDRLFRRFAQIELSVAVLGGLSSLLLFLSFLHLHGSPIVMYAETVAIGLLVGAEIPILTRIVEADQRHLRLTLSSIFSIDYIGGLIGSIAFPIVLLPRLGFFATSFLCGLVNALAASVVLWRYGRRIDGVRPLRTVAVAVVLAMMAGIVMSDRIAKGVEGGLYRDTVILSEQTPYQKLVLTKREDASGGDLRMFIDGSIQFSSKDEYRYHEALVHVPMSSVTDRSHVLILGGGDGLAAREVLKYPDVEDVTIVDLDPEVTGISRSHHDISSLNGGSLDDRRVTVTNGDAAAFLRESKGRYGVIIIDLPDPNNEVLNQLYTGPFYRLVGNHLSDGGVFVTQSTSPYYAREAFWCINETIASEGFSVLPYHLEVPSFGDWGFNMASKSALSRDLRIRVDTRYLTNEMLPALFMFGGDESRPDGIRVNTMNRPVLIDYYEKALATWMS